MKQTIFIFMALCFSIIAFGQVKEKVAKFQWVTAAQGMMAITYQDMESLPDGGVIALANRFPVNFQPLESVFIQGNGEKYKEYDLIANSPASLLISFDSNGVLNWVQKTEPKFSHLYQISIGETGEIDLLVKIYERGRNVKYEPIGYYRDEDEDELPAGYGIVTIDKQGYLVDHRPIKGILPSAKPEFLDFQRLGDEFIINGNNHKGKLVPNFEIEAGKSGGQFIMAIDKDGNPTWVDIVASSKETCCSWSKPSHFDIAPDGTIYFGGMFSNGGIFSNGEVTQNTPFEPPNDKNDAWETFVICYSTERKINWVKTTGSPSIFGKLVATNEGVYVGYGSYGKKSFGQKIKPSDPKFSTLISFLKADGKLKWNQVFEASSFESLKKGLGGSLVMCGRSSDTNNETPRKFGNFEFGPKDELFVATLSSNGVVQQFWSADLWTTKGEPLLMSQNANGEFFVALQTWCTLTIGMNLINPSFPDIQCYGGSPVLGKIKF